MAKILSILMNTPMVKATLANLKTQTRRVIPWQITANMETPRGLDTTGVQGTGCVFCLFGMQLETGQNRIQQLARSHPHLWKYCMDKLGMRDVLQYIRDNANPRLANKFYCEPCAVSKVLNLPGM